MLRRLYPFAFTAIALSGLGVVLTVGLAGEYRATKSSQYFIELLWWPEYCHEHPDLRYCAGASFRGFVPRRFAKASDWGQVPTCANVTNSFRPDDNLLKLLPDEELLRSEWETHGSCSGLSQNAYFDHLAQAFKSVVIPRQFVRPDKDFPMSPERVKQAFAQANPDLSPPSGVFVFCRSGFLSAVQVQRLRNARAPNEVCSDTQVEILARMPLAE